MSALETNKNTIILTGYMILMFLNKRLHDINEARDGVDKNNPYGIKLNQAANEITYIKETLKTIKDIPESDYIAGMLESRITASIEVVARILNVTPVMWWMIDEIKPPFIEFSSDSL